MLSFDNHMYTTTFCALLCLWCDWEQYHISCFVCHMWYCTILNFSLCFSCHTCGSVQYHISHFLVMWVCTIPHLVFWFIGHGILYFRRCTRTSNQRYIKKKCRKSNKTQRKDFIVAVYCCFVCVFCVVFVSVCLSGGIQESKQTYGTNKKSSNFYSVTIWGNILKASDPEHVEVIGLIYIF